MIGRLLGAPSTIELLERDRPVAYARGDVRPGLSGLTRRRLWLLGRGGTGEREENRTGREQSHERDHKGIVSSQRIRYRRTSGAISTSSSNLRQRGLQMWRLGMPIERRIVTPPLNEAEIARIGRVDE